MNNFNWLFLYEHGSLFISYGIGFNHPRALLKYISLMTVPFKTFYTIQYE